MSLINTNTDKRVINPSIEGNWLEVDHAFIIPTIDTETTCTVQVRLSSGRNNPIGDVGTHNIGSAVVDGLQDPELDAKLHAYCIGVLGSNFVKQ